MSGFNPDFKTILVLFLPSAASLDLEFPINCSSFSALHLGFCWLPLEPLCQLPEHSSLAESSSWHQIPCPSSLKLVLLARFKITLKVPSELIASSNMPVLEEKCDGPSKTLHFEESPVMSTYLVAVVVGLFDYVEAFTSDGIIVRVYCQVGKSDQGKFALDVAVKSLEFYKGYFDVPYELAKLDNIAIPDFAAGAMENYGLVTYREAALLYDGVYSAASVKKSVVITVTHELAHQWFGNLVTLERWTHLWLNEGFASWSYFLANGFCSCWLTWIVPITVCFSSYENQKKFLLEKESGNLKFDGVIGSWNTYSSDKNPEDKVWIEFNVNQTGFCRTNYDAGLLSALVNAIKSHDLSATDRYGLLDDSNALCKAGKKTLSSLLLVLDAYRKEAEYVVLSQIISISDTVVYVAADATTELLDDFKRYFINYFQRSAEKLGWDPKDGESLLDTVLRGEVLTALPKLGDKKTREEGARCFNAFLNDKKTSFLSPDTRKAAYFSVMQSVTKSGRSGFDSFLRVYREADQSEEEGRVLGTDKA